MIFVFHLIDSPDSAAPRAEFMAQHKAYIAAVADRIAFAGPLVGDDGKATAGSLLAIDFADRAAADQ
ncbi:MAG: YciI family protein, partial [Variovorax sp.]